MPFRQVVQHRSPREPYKADALVIWCVDDRFDSLYQVFIRRIGLKYADQIKVPGGATKSLSAKASPATKAYVLGQMELLLGAHNAPKIILAGHSDCSAHGGLRRFADDCEAERQFFEERLRTAAQCAQSAFRHVLVKCYLADFDGAHLLEF